MATYNLVQAVIDRSLLSADEDVAVMTMHIRQAVQASPDILPVTDQGRDHFTAAFTSFWNNVKGNIAANHVLKELRYYDVPAQAGLPMGDPVKVAPMNNPGLSSLSMLPPQCAVSVTWKTQHRKRWGRFYIPGFITTSLDGRGRLPDAACDQIGNAAHSLTDRSVTGGVLTVFSRKYWNHEDPTEIQVDNIIDVIRRRRFSHATYRFKRSAG